MSEDRERDSRAADGAAVTRAELALVRRVVEQLPAGCFVGAWALRAECEPVAYDAYAGGRRG